MSYQPIKVFAPTNIALLKYWGKVDKELNTATHPSISITLDHYGSETEVCFRSDLEKDQLILNGKDIPHFPKVSKVLNALRSFKNSSLRAHIRSTNNFPTAAGLASSASGLASVTYAASLALELDLSAIELAEISKQGSGSSCRSFLGGFVQWHDKEDPKVSQILSPDQWPLDVYLLLVSRDGKKTSSTQAMIDCQQTSVFFKEWVRKSWELYPLFREVIERRDFKKLGDLSEKHCLLMHKTILASHPPIVYWSDQTLEYLRLVRGWQREGLEVFFTIDAGANVVLVCEKNSSVQLQSKLESLQADFLKTCIGTGPMVKWGQVVC
ncbi:MAG: diphosphomevalonate decarboxylase [Deltaproteobacteria bacterium]|nr:diphosphomevalonate decarboxylase [Deltaproteobacteria bacterium]